MAEAVVNVARRINAIVEDGTDFLGEALCTSLFIVHFLYLFLFNLSPSV